MERRNFEGSQRRINVVLEAGEKNFPTLVFLPGSGNPDAHPWLKNIAHRLDGRFPKLFVNRLGVAQSAETKAERILENICQELHELISNLVKGLLIFLCHSLSGMFAYAYSSYFPEQVLGIVAIEPLVRDLEKYITTAAYQKAENEFSKLSENEILKITDDPEWTTAEKAEISASYRTKVVEGTTLWQEEQLFDRNFQAYGKLPILSLPTLIIFQPNRRTEFENSEFANANSRLLELAGNHYLHFVHPKKVATATNLFIAALGGGDQ